MHLYLKFIGLNNFLEPYEASLTYRKIYIPLGIIVFSVATKDYSLVL